jgi:hypothetical protein
VIFILSWLSELLLEKTVPIVNRIVPKVEELPKMDGICQQRGGDVLNLSTNTKKPSKNITFKCHTSVENQRVVYSEIDSDSHVSLIEQNYFENCLLDKIDKSRFIDEDFPRFKGIGGQVTISDYPPVRLMFQIGGVVMSGRFIVTKHLTTSELLIGTDIMSKYQLTIIPYKNDWKVSIGSLEKPLAIIPCVRVIKTIESEDFCKRVALDEAEIKNELEIEPGMEPIKIIDKEAELNFIKKLPHIPDHCKKQLLECLEKIPDLYSGAEFSTKTFTPELFQHDIEFVNEKVSELSLKPYPASGIRLAQLKEQINNLVKSGVLKEGEGELCYPGWQILEGKGQR